MYDFQNIDFPKSHLKHAHRGFKPRMDRHPVAKQTIRLCGTFQEVSKACIGCHDHVGCYAKKKNNKKLKIYNSLEIYESLEIH